MLDGKWTLHDAGRVFIPQVPFQTGVAAGPGFQMQEPQHESDSKSLEDGSGVEQRSVSHQYWPGSKWSHLLGIICMH
jgi:hypothetical protein